MNYYYSFPVVRGMQATREYYIAMMPLRMVKILFPEDKEYVAPEYRAQRKLNESRVPIIKQYILDNKESYVFSALAASIDGEMRFHPSETSKDVGILDVSMDAIFLINDGQHRKAAIIEALNEDASIGDETISVVLYEDQGLKRSQQIFTDLNKNAVRTSNSISELYDSRDEMAVITREILKEISFLDSYTDKEKDILGKYSSKLFTLNTFYLANKIIIGKRKESEKYKNFLLEYWKCVANNIEPWAELEKREISKIELREQYIVTQGVVIQALGRVGAYLADHPNISIPATIKKLKKINWKRSDLCWKYRAINDKGRIITNKNAIILIANYIKLNTGLPLTEEEIKAEENIKIYNSGV